MYYFGILKLGEHRTSNYETQILFFIVVHKISSQLTFQNKKKTKQKNQPQQINMIPLISIPSISDDAKSWLVISFCDDKQIASMLISVIATTPDVH